MIKIYMRTKQGEVIGRAPETSKQAFMTRVNHAKFNNDFITIEEPANAQIIQTTVVNEQGLVQLVDGRFVPQNVAQQVGPQGLMLRNILRMVSMNVAELDILASEIIQVREMSQSEGEEYTRGINAAKITSSKLETKVSGIELPEELV